MAMGQSRTCPRHTTEHRAFYHTKQKGADIGPFFIGYAAFSPLRSLQHTNFCVTVLGCKSKNLLLTTNGFLDLCLYLIHVILGAWQRHVTNGNPQNEDVIWTKLC